MITKDSSYEIIYSLIINHLTSKEFNMVIFCIQLKHKYNCIVHSNQQLYQMEDEAATDAEKGEKTITSSQAKNSLHVL